MSLFASKSDVGVLNTFIVLGCVYFVFMMVGSLIVRCPPPAGDRKVMCRRSQPPK